MKAASLFLVCFFLYAKDTPGVGSNTFGHIYSCMDSILILQRSLANEWFSEVLEAFRFDCDHLLCLILLLGSDP